VAVVAAGAPGFIPPGFLALALVYSFQLTTYLKFLVRVMATLEAQLNSVERIKYYMDHIEVEGAPLAHKMLDVDQVCSFLRLCSSLLCVWIVCIVEMAFI